MRQAASTRDHESFRFIRELDIEWSQDDKLKTTQCHVSHALRGRTGGTSNEGKEGDQKTLNRVRRRPDGTSKPLGLQLVARVSRGSLSREKESRMAIFSLPPVSSPASLPFRTAGSSVLNSNMVRDKRAAFYRHALS